jgi:hypothetical protein
MIFSIAMKVAVVCAAVYVASFVAIKLIGSGIDVGELLTMLLDHRRCYEHPWFVLASVVMLLSRVVGVVSLLVMAVAWAIGA